MIKIRKAINVNTDSKSMSFKDKGRILTLVDSNTKLSAIVELTSWSEERIKNVIEGMSGTRAWTDAKIVWKEGKDGSRYNRTNNTSGKTSNNRKSRSNVNGTRTNKTRIRSSKGTLPKSGSKQCKSSYNRGKQGRVGSQDQHDTTLVETLRKSKDYAGE